MCPRETKRFTAKLFPCSRSNDRLHQGTLNSCIGIQHQDKAFACTGYPIGHFPVGYTIYNSLRFVHPF
nr:MAG TPA: hypothetical protein [Bacteriophage sp.]